MIEETHRKFNRINKRNTEYKRKITLLIKKIIEGVYLYVRWKKDII
jgi:hypothetical protein